MRRRRNRLQLVLTLILVTLLAVYMMLELVQKNEVVAHEDVEPQEILLEEEYVENTEELWLRNIPLSKELQEYTWQVSEEYGIAYDLVLAVMKTESNFNPKAIGKNSNSSQDFGLMQLNNKFHQEHASLIGATLEEFDAFNPYMNIHAGVAVLAARREYWQSRGVNSQEQLFSKILLSYNRGIEGAKSYIVNRGTDRSDYVEKVLNNKILIETEGGL